MAMRRMLAAAALLLLLPGCILPRFLSDAFEAPPSEDCPGHWHATFAIFLPGADGEPQRVDFATPRTPSGQSYYDFQAVASGGAAKMTISVHMHKVGGETGSEELGSSQWHYEAHGKCVSLETSLSSVDVAATADSLILTGGHLQIPGQHGTFAATDGVPLRWWLESEGDGWTWREVGWAEIRKAQLLDGQALLVALATTAQSRSRTCRRRCRRPSPASGSPRWL